MARANEFSTSIPASGAPPANRGTELPACGDSGHPARCVCRKARANLRHQEDCGQDARRPHRRDALCHAPAAARAVICEIHHTRAPPVPGGQATTHATGALSFRRARARKMRRDAFCLFVAGGDARRSLGLQLVPGSQRVLMKHFDRIEGNRSEIHRPHFQRLVQDIVRHGNDVRS